MDDKVIVLIDGAYLGKVTQFYGNVNYPPLKGRAFYV
jgi:hypothetical protein